jgi:general secretion pathway protein A
VFDATSAGGWRSAWRAWRPAAWPLPARAGALAALVAGAAVGGALVGLRQGVPDAGATAAAGAGPDAGAPAVVPTSTGPAPADGAGARAGQVADAESAAGLDVVLASAHRSEAEAWRALSAHWRLVLPDGVAPCVAAAAAGVACFRAAGGLPLLRQIDRPALLPLRDPASGAAGWVQLTGLDGQRVTVRGSAAAHTLPLADLAPAWRGEVATLWRVPPGWAADRLPGAPSPALREWVGAQLPPADGATAARAAGFTERVRGFQLVHGLPPDGLPGPITLMRLARSAGIDEPRLGAD